MNDFKTGITVKKKLHDLREKIKKMGNNKMPPSEECFKIMEMMADYHDNLIKEKKFFESHVKSCIWCFNFYIKFTEILKFVEQDKPGSLSFLIK